MAAKSSSCLVRQALTACGLTWEELPGEGAFYGPKVEYHIRDAIGRSWQCGTLQLDFVLPGRLGAEYVAEDNTRKVPVMLHRAVLGSMERFIGILIEHHAGSMPTWLAPVQAVVLNITDRAAAAVQAATDRLRGLGHRAEADLRNEKIGFKIREHTLRRIPYLLVIGDREVETGSVAVRTRTGKDLGVMTLGSFEEFLAADVASRGRSVLEG